jgi:uncharacterized repeat protein (TIGR03803 family)
VTLASFNPANGTDGAYPQAGLVEDSSGNLFGTTYAGGASNNGTVFEVAAGSGRITTLASFNPANGTDGAGPEGGLVEDSSGNLFGTTHFGGAYGIGTVFEVAAGSGRITTLASFDPANGTDGTFPQAGLVEDSSGNLFGTTYAGGAYSAGTVFEVAAGSGRITTLASFNPANGTDGGYPYAGLVEDSSGNLFGTTYYGGAYGAGTVFEIPHPVVSISGMPALIPVTGAGTFTVSRTDPAGVLQVALAVDGSSTEPAGYTLTGPNVSYGNGIYTVSFANGDPSETVTFTPAANPSGMAEASHTLQLDLQSSSAYGVSSAQASSAITVAANGFLVTNTNATGEGSLAQAVANADADTSGTPVAITFDSASGHTFATAQTITLAATLNLTNTTSGESIAINGPGANLLTIDGNNSIEVFSVDSGVSAVLNGLTIAHGDASSGGGIFNSGALALSNCTLSGNQATSLTNGGGALTNAGTATVTNSTFTNNSAASSGGAICDVDGVLNVSDSTFSGNSAFDGGAILSNSAPDMVTVTNSTFSQNSATIAGGGIYNCYGSLTVSSCTFSGNAAHSPYSFGGGAGIYYNGIGSATVTNTIVANSLGWGGVFLASGGNSFTGSNDLIDDTSAGANSSNGYFGAASLYNVAAGLDPNGLQNNGGPTQTIALLPGSPALDAGSNAAASAAGLATDQRGQARITDGAVDIGAFESQGFTLSVTSGSGQSAPVGAAFANPLVVTVSSAYGEPVAGGQVSFTAPASGASASLSGAPATIGANGQASVTATANGVAGQNYSVTASAAGAGAAGFTLSNTSATTSTTLATSVTPAVLYQPVTFTATVIAPASGVSPPTGTVTFLDGGTVLGTASLNGVAVNDQATFTTNSLTPGTHAHITAVYGGDATFLGSTSGYLSQVVTSTPQLQNGVLAIPGTAGAATITLTPILPTGASAYSMRVAETIGASTTTFGAYALPGGSIVVYGGPSTDALVLNGTASNDRFTAGPGAMTEVAAQNTAQATTFTVGLNGTTGLALKGAGGADSLTGPNQVNTWTITAANAGTLNGATFSGIANLTGGAGADDFMFANNTATISGNVDGGAGANALDFSGRGAAVTATLATTGLNKATPITGAWANVATLVGSAAGADTLVGPTRPPPRRSTPATPAASPGSPSAASRTSPAVPRPTPSPSAATAASAATSTAAAARTA